MAVITSPDTIVSATVVVANQDGEGAYPIKISSITPTGQAVSIEYNGVRIFEGQAAPGTGTEG